MTSKAMDRTISRRNVLKLAMGLPLLAAGGGPAFAGEALIARLIRDARVHPQVSQRIDMISRALLGVRYQANTLIGGPDHREVFVVRDDAFDCVTFCEFVLAAARAENFKAFEEALRQIRYEHGLVRWEKRNHYFADWCRRAVENKICTPVAIADAVTLDKTVDWPPFGRRRVAITAVPRASLLANRTQLAAGDVIGFVSRRPNLDFFHTGLVAFGKDGDLLLRHASRSRGRILDDRMETFVTANGVGYVTLLRATESPSVV
jgi:hypothetical protein